MIDRTFSVIGFGKRCESIASQLNTEGIGVGWDRDTRLLMILVDKDESDDFVVRLCKKVKEKQCCIVFLCLSSELAFAALQEVADGILVNDNEQEVLSIVRTLKRVIYMYNLLSYDINDVIHFLRTKQVGTISSQDCRSRKSAGLNSPIMRSPPSATSLSSTFASSPMNPCSKK